MLSDSQSHSSPAWPVICECHHRRSPDRANRQYRIQWSATVTTVIRWRLPQKGRTGEIKYFMNQLYSPGWPSTEGDWSKDCVFGLKLWAVQLLVEQQQPAIGVSSQLIIGNKLYIVHRRRLYKVINHSYWKEGNTDNISITNSQAIK